MKLSENNKYTGNLLMKASTNAEWTSIDYCIVEVNEKVIEEWEYRSQVAKRTKDLDENLAHTMYWGSTATFLENVEIEGEEDFELEEGEWIWVEIEDDEELPEPEMKMSGADTKVYGEGSVSFIDYGKHTGDEVWSESINIEEIKASMI